MGIGSQEDIEEKVRKTAEVNRALRDFTSLLVYHLFREGEVET